MRIFLSDFDGTIVNRDILDVICGITGHEKDSEKINKEGRFGVEPLIERINFLKGVTKQQIFEKLNENNYLVSGAKELFSY